MSRERLDTVERYLKQVVPHIVIEQKLCREWNCERRSIRNYIQRVYEEWQQRAERIRPYARERMRVAFEDFYNRALQKGDMKSAVIALDRLARLDGVYAPDRVQVQHSGSVATSLDPVKVRARIAELLVKNPHLLPGKNGHNKANGVDK